MSFPLTLDDPVQLTTELIDIPSVSHNEQRITDTVEATLHSFPHLQVQRHGNTVVAQTHLDRASRVILAGHLDTVPVAHNIPHTYGQLAEEPIISGLGSVDMKSGDAVFLHLAKKLTNPSSDITFIFYDCEEVESHFNGLGKLYAVRPELLQADLAILGEPTQGFIEAGCQGSLRGRIDALGTRAHSARSWLGHNAIHALTPALAALTAYLPRTVPVDGLEYRESFSAVKITGGIAGNVIPDTASMEFNYRFAPNKDAVAATRYVEEFFAPTLAAQAKLTITDIAPGALPGLTHPITQKLLQAAGGRVGPKFGWTDVSRFSQLGIPAVNLGPGDPSLAHKPEEYVPISQIHYVTQLLSDFLSA